MAHGGKNGVTLEDCAASRASRAPEEVGQRVPVGTFSWARAPGRIRSRQSPSSQNAHTFRQHKGVPLLDLRSRRHSRLRAPEGLGQAFGVGRRFFQGGWAPGLVRPDGMMAEVGGGEAAPTFERPLHLLLAGHVSDLSALRAGAGSGAGGQAEFVAPPRGRGSKQLPALARRA